MPRLLLLSRISLTSWDLAWPWFIIEVGSRIYCCALSIFESKEGCPFWGAAVVAWCAPPWWIDGMKWDSSWLCSWVVWLRLPILLIFLDWSRGGTSCWPSSIDMLWHMLSMFPIAPDSFWVCFGLIKLLPNYFIFLLLPISMLPPVDDMAITCCPIYVLPPMEALWLPKFYCDLFSLLSF